MALKKKAQQVRRAGSKNSNQDSMLAHISPGEATLLKAYGGSGRQDPETGLPHFDDPGIGDPGVSDGIGVPAGGDAPSGDNSGLGDFSNTDLSGFLGNEGNFGFSNGDPSAISEGVTSPDVSSQPAQDENIISKMFKGVPVSLAKGQVLGQLAHAVGLPSIPGLSAITGAIAGQPPATPSQALGNFGSMGMAGLGGLFGGPVGAAIGGLAGGLAGSNISAPPSMSAGDISAANAATSNPSNSAGNSGMLSDFINQLTSGSGMGSLLTGLGGLYAGHQSSNLYNNTMDQINNLYSPNSPYAQQMRQEMERKDAASGRRSQYGTRETQLAAALAQAHAGALTGPGYANMMNGANRSNQQGLNTLISLFNGRGGQSLLGGLGHGLSNLYAQNNNSNYSNEGLNYPNYTGQGLDLGGGGNNYNYGDMETGW